MYLLILFTAGITALAALPVCMLAFAIRHLLFRNVTPISKPRSARSKLLYVFGGLTPTILLIAVLPISYGIMILYPPNDNFLLPPAVLSSVTMNCMIFAAIVLDGLARRYVASEPRVRFRADMENKTTYNSFVNQMLLINFLACIPLVLAVILYFM